jgi:hypothetical protein
VSAANLKDKWNLWTFSTNFNGDVRAEERQQRRPWTLVCRCRPTSTADWKLNFSVSGNRNEQRSTSRRRPTRGLHLHERAAHVQRNSLIVKSLDDHWSAGVKLGAGYSDFLNQDLALRAQPAVEYNLFPWTEQTRRQLTFLYNVGPNYYDYQRTTVFDR